MNVNSDATWINVAGSGTRRRQSRALLEWAVRSTEAAQMLDLPREFKDRVIQP
jgi:hypothetical protein